MLPRGWIAVALCIMLAGCGGKDAPPAPGGSTSGDVSVSGGERLGWSQQAAHASELSGFQYAIYIDGNRSVLTGVTCSTTAGSAGFDCSAPLPALTPGSHTLELAAFVNDGGVLESARSPALRVIRAGLSLSSGLQINPSVVTAEQVHLNLELVADGLALPSDLQFSPDGSLLIAERGGAIRVIRDGKLLPDPALDLSGEVWLPEGGLLAIAVDPKFDVNRFVYTLTAAKAGGASLAFTLARYRSVNDRLGDRAVLLDRIPASAQGAGGALRIGPDEKIYVALDAASNPRVAGNLGSYNGKVLRLNVDATTPDDQAGFSPVFSVNHPLPRALDWQPSSGEMWVVDTLEQTSGRLTALAVDDARQKRGVARTNYALPNGTGAASAAFYRGNKIAIFRDNLFVAAEAGRHLLRFQFDPRTPERIVSAERLLQDQIGEVRVVAAGPDEGLYIASDRALFRLAP